MSSSGEVKGKSPTRFWDDKKVPDSTSSEFKKMINRDAVENPSFIPSDENSSYWDEPPNPKSCSSFGDNGVTASVSAYGDLMQFSSFQNAGISGMFSADQASIPEPYYVVWRADELLGMAGERKKPEYGLAIPCIDRSKGIPPMRYVFDRWPRYSFDDDSFEAELQWMVHEKTVLQQWVIENKAAANHEASLSFGLGMHIRELEYLDSRNLFNEDCRNQVFLNSPHDYGKVIAHKLAIGNEASHVAVLVSIFVNGKAIQWGDEQSADEQSTSPYNFQVTFPGKAKTEVITAYRMITLSENKGNLRAWDNFLISPTVANVGEHLAGMSKTFKPFFLSQCCSVVIEPPEKSLSIKGHLRQAVQPFNHIDYVLRRNIEHILSVCAIPVGTSESNGDIAPTALTCGDVSGHRLCSSASFFTFTFLLKVVERLRQASEAQGTTYLESLQQRIHNICRGHLKWLEKADKGDQGVFSANYWVTGNFMQKGSSSFTPEDSLTDTAFQLIKVSEFQKVYSANQDQESLNNMFLAVARKWIEHLEKMDRRNVCAWSGTNIGGTPKFRLDFHVWIWRALKAIAVHIDTNPTKGHEDNKVSGNNEDPQGTKKEKLSFIVERLNKRLAPDRVQREILRRFNTENDVSKKHMLTTARSSRETRFLFHASDTSLFHALDFDFFLPDSSFNELWQNTIDAQLHHVANSDMGWTKTLRYVLTLMIGSNGNSINEKSPAGIVDTSLRALFQSTSSHGIFYGYADETTKGPTMFSMKSEANFYFHASFEIPFVLLKYRWDSLLKSPMANIGGQDAYSREQSALQSKSHLAVPTEDHRHCNMHPKNVSDPRSQPSSQNTAGQKPDKLMIMKKSIPFNSLIDQTRVVNLADEWLYNYPAFFARDDDLTDDDFKKERDKLAGEKADEQADGQAESYMGNLIVVGAAKAHKKRNNDRQGKPDAGFHAGLDAGFHAEFIETRIMDVAKKEGHKRRKGHNPRALYRSYDAWIVLRKIRTAAEAKKRLIWLSGVSRDIALVCYIASPGDEMPAVSLFFDRHYHRDNSFYEDVNLPLNTWESELHLSFYRLGKKVRGQDTALQLSERGEDYFPGDDTRKLIHTSMGFRFNGDFFDRYWTCHVISHVGWDFWGDNMALLREQQCWRQRKVLELHIFNTITTKIAKETKDILDDIGEQPGLKNGIFLPVVSNSDIYFSSIKHWRNCQQVLQVVEEQISEVLATIAKWEGREKERGQEQPRWTRNDEGKYRLTLRKFEDMNRRRVKGLREYHDNIKLLMKRLVSTEEQIRNDLNLHGAENVRYFTYVTVIFLPLGFAASIFSMGDAPPQRGTLVNMIIYAAVALSITIVALTNAKKLASVLRRRLIRPFSSAISKFSSARRKKSPLIDHDATTTKKKQKNRTDAESGAASEAQAERASQTQPGPGLEMKNAKSSHIWFWPAFIFLELPSRRVLAAYDSLKTPKFADLRFYLSILFGIALLPILILSHMFRILLYNITDLARLGWEPLKKIVAPLFKNKGDRDEQFQDRLSELVKLPSRCRPLKNYRESRFGPENNIEYGPLTRAQAAGG